MSFPGNSFFLQSNSSRFIGIFLLEKGQGEEGIGGWGVEGDLIFIQKLHLLITCEILLLISLCPSNITLSPTISYATPFLFKKSFSRLWGVGIRRRRVEEGGGERGGPGEWWGGGPGEWWGRENKCEKQKVIRTRWVVLDNCHVPLIPITFSFIFHSFSFYFFSFFCVCMCWMTFIAEGKIQDMQETFYSLLWHTKYDIQKFHSRLSKWIKHMGSTIFRVENSFNRTGWGWKVLRKLACTCILNLWSSENCMNSLRLSAISSDCLVDGLVAIPL